MKTILVTIAFSVAAFFSVGALAHDMDHGTKPDAHLVFAGGAIHAHIFWEVGPISGTESEMRIEFMNGANHTPLAVASAPDVMLWMPDMGHGSGPTDVTPVLDPQGQVLPGVYHVGNIFFVMEGVWEMRVTLKAADGTSETQTFSVPVGATDPDHHHQM